MMLCTSKEAYPLQVFNLGADGKEFRKVAEVTDFIKQAERAAGDTIERSPTCPCLDTKVHG